MLIVSRAANGLDESRLPWAIPLRSDPHGSSRVDCSRVLNSRGRAIRPMLCPAVFESTTYGLLPTQFPGMHTQLRIP